MPIKPPLSAQVNRNHPLTKGLVGCWLLDEGGGLIARDRSWFKNNGTLTGGPTRIVGKFGRALSFDGTDDYVDCGLISKFENLAQLSICAWLYRSSTTHAVTIGTVASTTRRVAISLFSDGNLYFLFSNGSSAFGSIASTIVGWNFICLTFDGSLSGSAKLNGYVNGKNVVLSYSGTLPTTCPSNANQGAFKIGANSTTSYSTGRFDNAFIFNRALRAAEVLQLYADPFCLFADDETLGKSAGNVTTSQTITGKSRISAQIDQTIGGKSRISAQTTQTQTGKSRIAATTDQTQAGKSRISAQTLQTQTGKSRISAQSLATQTGKSRITGTIDRTIGGKSRITIDGIITNDATIGGKSRISDPPATPITLPVVARSDISLDSEVDPGSIVLDSEPDAGQIELEVMSAKKCAVNTTPNPATCTASGSGGSGGGGGTVPPSDDPRCKDAAFYDANPDICAGYPRLILKPETAIVESGGTVLYKTYLRTGGNEIQITLGLAYASANLDVAMIEASGGIATGAVQGITTISVAWQDLSAYAQIEVTESCALLSSNFLILIDNSKSMGQAFSSSYSSKLSFAKAMANEFIDSVNFGKDQVSVYEFNSSPTRKIEWNQVASDSKAVVNAIVSSNGKSDYYSAIVAATEYLALQAGVKVLILFGDGEDNGQYDSLQISKAFKESGGIIVVIGTRAWGSFFDFLYKTASAGYFLNGYGATQDTVKTTLPNLKSYICSGDCQPTAGTSPKAQLNYNEFLNWDVIEGYVDIVGLGLYDIRPGNGLYVDLAGTADFPASPDGPNVGPFGMSKMRSKLTFDLVAGDLHKFGIMACGYAGGPTSNSIKITIGSHLVETQITPVGDFVLYEFEFTPASSTSEYIVIEQVTRAGQNQGTLIDSISLENLQTSTVLLEDDFDTENPTTTPSGYGSYYGCITAPPGAQTADPTPPTPVVVE